MKKINKRKINYRVLLWQILGFSLTQIIGLIAAYRIIYHYQFFQGATAPDFTWWSFLISFFVAVILIIVLLKFVKGKILFLIIYYLALGSGIFIILSQFSTFQIAGYLTFIILIASVLYNRVWFHNIFIILGVAGISVNLGLRLSVMASLIILLVVSIYDYIAVLKSKTMTKIFYGFLERGLALSLIVPEKASGFKEVPAKTRPGQGFFFLGTGDLAFPLIFAVSVMMSNVLGAVLVIIGALIGVVAVQLMLFWSKKKQALPALPPIALFSVLGYLVSLLV